MEVIGEEHGYSLKTFNGKEWVVSAFTGSRFVP